MRKLPALFLVLALMISCAEKVVKPISAKELPAKEIAQNTAVSTQNYDREKAKNLYETACYKCHDLYKPKDYTDEQWIPIMKSMAPKASLNAEQSALVLQYLTSEN